MYVPNAELGAMTHPVSFEDARSAGQMRGQCTRVIDGDTIEALMDLGFNVQLVMRFRLKDFDAAEVRGTSGKELRLARRQTRQLEALVLDKAILVRTYRPSFERYVAEVWDADGHNVIDAMVELSP
jgi:micrococcal nuclease